MFQKMNKEEMEALRSLTERIAAVYTDSAEVKRCIMKPDEKGDALAILMDIPNKLGEVLSGLQNIVGKEEILKSISGELLMLSLNSMDKDRPQYLRDEAEKIGKLSEFKTDPKHGGSAVLHDLVYHKIK